MAKFLFGLAFGIALTVLLWPRVSRGTEKILAHQWKQKEKSFDRRKEVFDNDNSRVIATHKEK